MIQPLSWSALYEVKMNNAKRPRNSTNSQKPPTVDLTSDDEAPPLKRQKSVPPAPATGSPAYQGLLSSEAGRDATPDRKTVKGGQQLFSTHSIKKSPFSNKPVWLVTSAGSESLDNKHPVPIAYGGSSSSITSSSRISHSIRPEIRNELPPDIQNRQPQTVVTPESRGPSDGFILPPTTTLKFDPQAQDILTNFPQTEIIRGLNPATRTSSPKLGITIEIPKPTSSQDKIVSVSLPVRPSPTSSQQTRGQAHLSAEQPPPSPFHHAPLFQRQPGTSQVLKSTISVNVPLPVDKQKRRDLRHKLQKDAQYASVNPGEVEKILGITGFSTVYRPDNDENRMKKGAQPKKRTVDRRSVPLEMLGKTRLSSGHGRTEAASLNLVHPREQVKSILTDRFSEQFDVPLTFSNNTNDRRLNGKFQFIKEYILRKGVRTTGAIPRPGCTCMSGVCDEDCACLSILRTTQVGQGDQKRISAYTRRSDGLVILTDDYINARSEINECGERCPCSFDCINRVVQRGRTVALEIFETLRCGFGVRSTQDLVRGQFIELYLGEVLTESELEHREAAAEENQSSYVYSLDWFKAQNSYHIDGQNFGSAMRFVNHSCDPNARTFTVMDHKSTKNLYYIAFFAIKDIPAGTEICIDYIPQNALDNETSDDDDDDGDDDNTNTASSSCSGTSKLHSNLNALVAKLRVSYNKEDEEVQECLCGAPNCRQRLWGGPKRKGRRKRFGSAD